MTHHILMKRKWVKVVTTSNNIHATMLKNLLDNEGLEVVLVNKQDSAYVAIGEIELRVPHDQVIIAKRILQKVS